MAGASVLFATGGGSLGVCEPLRHFRNCVLCRLDLVERLLDSLSLLCCARQECLHELQTLLGLAMQEHLLELLSLLGLAMQEGDL